LSAQTTSGSGTGNVGVAGSSASNIETVPTLAELALHPARGPPSTTARVNGGNVSITVAAAVNSTTNAMSTVRGSGSVATGERWS
jgi:hypothetical protein